MKKLLVTTFMGLLISLSCFAKENKTSKNEMPDVKFKDHENAICNDIKTLVKFESISRKDLAEPGAPYGMETAKCLIEAEKICKHAGFEFVRNSENYYGYAEWGISEDYIAILGHLDVVPANPEDWTKCLPYDAKYYPEEKKLYGRGVIDDKGPMVLCLHAMKALKDAGFEPKTKIRLIFGTDEETGCNGGIKKYMEDNPDSPLCGFTPDAHFPVVAQEKGVYHTSFTSKTDDLHKIYGGTTINIVPDSAWYNGSEENINKIAKHLEESEYKITDNKKIEVFGTNCHAMEPWLGDNAIVKLANAMYFSNLRSPIINFIHEEVKQLDISYETKTSHSVGIAEVDNEGRQRIQIDIRPSFDDVNLAEIEMTIDNLTDKYENSLIVEVNQDTIEKPINKSGTLLCEILKNTYAEISGDNESPEVAIGGSTYAKALPNIIGYGPYLPNEPLHIHCPDEYFDYDNAKESFDIYLKVIFELSNSTYEKLSTLSDTNL